jgi:hypothetical protein
VCGMGHRARKAFSGGATPRAALSVAFTIGGRYAGGENRSTKTPVVRQRKTSDARSSSSRAGYEGVTPGVAGRKRSLGWRGVSDSVAPLVARRVTVGTNTACHPASVQRTRNGVSAGSHGLFKESAGDPPGRKTRPVRKRGLRITRFDVHGHANGA